MFSGYPKKVNNKWGAFVSSSTQPTEGDLVVITTRAGKQWISIVQDATQSEEGYLVTLKEDRVRRVEVKFVFDRNGKSQVQHCTWHYLSAIDVWNDVRNWDGNEDYCPVKCPPRHRLSGVRYKVA